MGGKKNRKRRKTKRNKPASESGGCVNGCSKARSDHPAAGCISIEVNRGRGGENWQGLGGLLCKALLFTITGPYVRGERESESVRVE